MLSVRALAPFLLAASVALPVWAQAPKPLATLDGIAITEDDIKAAQEDIGASMPRMDDAQKRKYLVDYVLDLKLLSRAAEKQKLSDGPDFARKLAYLKDRALMEALMAREGNAAIAGDKLQKFYDEAVKGLPPEEEAHARHILVPEEEEAKKIVARLKAGEDFAKLAKELSKDPGSGKEGGDLGWFGKGQMVPEFADAAFALKAGEVSVPVKSQFGWHIIKLEEKRNKPLPPLAEVREELTRYMMQKAQQEMIMKLRSEAKIDLADEFKPKPADTKPAEATKPADQKKP